MKSILIVAALVCLAIPVQATYYEITTGYTPGLTLVNNDLLLMTGGGVGALELYNSSLATIHGTSTLEQGFGGIWYLSMFGSSTLDFSGGELAHLGIGYYATAALSGGKIVQIWSGQSAWKVVEIGPHEWVLVPNPHIEIICREYNYNTATKKLTGIWNVDNNKDGLFDIFNIQLVNVQGHSPAIENIKFTIVPEPVTMLLLAAGGLLVRRR